MKQVLKRAVRSPAGRRLSEGLAYLVSRANPDLLARSLQGDVYSLHLPQRVASLIDAVPTETTPLERRFFYRYFADHWPGTGDVVEIGPFLGGTTRAIALGMADNPRRRPSSRLRTFDRFHSYHDVSSLRNLLQPLIQSGRLSIDELERSGDSVQFLDIFRAIHAQSSYWDLIHVSSLPVPDLPSELDGGREFLKIDAEAGAVFVDGCKSWFGTKYFMRSIAPFCEPGTPILFQDYRCRTCFWITAFVELFRDKFRLFAQADDTYAFLLTERLDPEEIEHRFPDQPDGLSSADFERLFGGLIARERDEGDLEGALIHKLHLVGALAYIDDKDRARALLAGIDANALSPHQRHLLKLASRSPTYMPQGDVTL